MATLQWGAATDVGRMRSINQDTYLVVGDAGLFLVADGMGGPQGGEVAARLAVETVRSRFADRTVESLVEAIHTANTEIYRRGTVDTSLRGMGTTLVAAAVVETDTGEVVAIANVGDSRVYRVTRGELEQLTDDHSLVADLVRAGRLSPEEAEVHPQRNIVTRALGVYERIQVDTIEVDVFAGDRYLLCTDGLFNEVPTPQIAAVLRRLDDPSDAASELVRLANESGGRDNITCLVIDVVDDEGRSAKASASMEATPGRDGDLAGFGTAIDDDDFEAAFGRGPRPEGDDAPPRTRRERRAQRGASPRRLTWRVVAFSVLVLAVLGGAFGTVWWYARSTYFVGYAGSQVVIYQGRPDGLLWFDPTIAERTSIARDEVPAEFRDAIASGKEHSSLDGARRYVTNVEGRIADLEDEHASTSTSSTTSTTQRRTTTTRG